MLDFSEEFCLLLGLLVLLLLEDACITQLLLLFIGLDLALSLLDLLLVSLILLNVGLEDVGSFLLQLFDLLAFLHLVLSPVVLLFFLDLSCILLSWSRTLVLKSTVASLRLWHICVSNVDDLTTSATRVVILGSSRFSVSFDFGNLVQDVVSNANWVDVLLDFSCTLRNRERRVPV